MAVRRSGWTRPGAIDTEEGRKGTAAADPVLMVTRDGNVAGAIVHSTPNGAVVPGHSADEDKAPQPDTRSPAEIEADLDRTRARLSSTLDELSERLSPRDLARRGGRQVKDQFVDRSTGKLRGSRVGPLGGGLAGAIGALVLLRRFGKRSDS